MTKLGLMGLAHLRGETSSDGTVTLTKPPTGMVYPDAPATYAYAPHEHIARVAHEVNRAYCQSIGDDTQPAWEDAPEWQRDSAIDGVRFTQANPDAKPADSHDNWMAQKRADGWGWGPVKDPARKEHPCYLPYDQLPQLQRTKDHLFQAVVRALSAD